MLEQSRKAEKRDWAGLLLPLLLVIAFVIFLIMMV
jgi:flagellar biogenesis protein FliO